MIFLHEFAVSAGVTDGSEYNTDALTPHTPSGHDANGPGLGLSLHYLLIYHHPKAGLGVPVHRGHNHCRAMVAEVWCWRLDGGAGWGEPLGQELWNGGSELDMVRESGQEASRGRSALAEA